MNRLHQFVLIGSTLVGSWLGMQAIHEAGHVLGAWLTGGRVERVVLNPLVISRTDLADNPRPLIVVWAGPVFGVVAPLLGYCWAAAVKWPGAFVVRFFAGFCSLCNGLYIGGGSFQRIGDCGDMLRHGSVAWQLWLFGAVTTVVGLVLWNGLGIQFGLGSANYRADLRVVYCTLAACLLLVAIGFIVDGK